MPYNYKRRYTKRAQRKNISGTNSGTARYVRTKNRSYYRQKYRGYKKVRSTWQTALPKKDTALMKFTYQDSGFDMITPAITFQSFRCFRANSCYDPDLTGAGVQPYGWDNWTALYNRYQVVASKITCYFSTNATTATCPNIRCFIIPSENASLANEDVSDLSRYPYSKQFRIGTNTTSGSSYKLVHYLSTKKVVGKARANDNEATSATNTNPNIDWNWLVYCDASEWSAQVQVWMNVKITYYTKMSEPVSQTHS